MTELPLQAWLAPELLQRLAGSLLHFIWQGAVIAMVAAIVLRLLADRSAESRYTVSIAALFLMLAAPLVTFVFYTQTGRLTLVLLTTIHSKLTASTASVTQAATQAAATAAWTQGIVLLWFIGVLLCSIRLIAGWRISRSLTRVGTSVVPSEIQQSFNEIMQRLALTKPVRLLASLRIDTPAAVGWLRPVVLLPITALTGLDENQLRAVFAHELAHIRRNDFLVNMMQRGVESVLFYHPAVWWLSSRIRSEREHCCDDLAVQICGDKVAYARALIELERVRTVTPDLAVAATGGKLTQRIHRVLGHRIVNYDWRSAIAALLFVVVWVTAGAWQANSTLNAKPFAPPPVPAAEPAPVVVKTVETTPGLAGAINAIAAIVTAEPVQPEPQLPAGTPVQTGVVTGILRTNTGVPLEEVRIALTFADRSIAFGALESQGLTAMTDSVGRYRLENISPGSYYILVGMNGPRFYYPGVSDRGQATAIQVTSGATIAVPDTVVSGGPVTGRVIATGKGRRIENLVLCCDYFKQVLYSQNGLKQGSPFTPTISDDGSFAFPFVPPGNYALSLGDRNVMPVSWALAVGPNGITGLQLNVAEGVEVQGTILDQIGKPVSASVRLIPRLVNSVFNTIGPAMYIPGRPFNFVNGTPQGPRVFLRGILVPKADPSLDDIQKLIVETSRTSRLQQYSSTSVPDGRFVFPSVYPGTYMLEISAGGIVLPGREIQVSTAGLANIALQVPAIQVTGRIILPNGGPLPKLNYVRVVRSGSDSDIFYGFPDPEGYFSVLLAPGRYRVFTEGLWSSVRSVSDGSRDITNSEFTIEGSRNSQIVITLEP